ncbi:MAG: nitroreductase family protein [Chloroflexota bacterium]
MTTEDRLSMSLGEAIFSMRAIRRIKPDPVSDADIRDMLEAAIRAPNGGNAQPWRFLVVKDEAKRAQFAPLYHEAWWAKRHDAGYHTPEDLPPKYRPAMRLADEIGEIPLLIFVCATAKGQGASESVIPAVQNLLLAARAMGIGGTITNLHPSVDGRVHALFGIPDTAQIVYCIPLGYPKGNFGPNRRKPLPEVCSFDHWDTPSPWQE